jgi:hypothetical protein
MEAAVIHHAVIRRGFLEGSLSARTNSSPANSDGEEPSGVSAETAGEYTN